MKLFHLNRVSGWKYISFNTQKQIKSENKFGKDSFKLFNNGFIGDC